MMEELGPIQQCLSYVAAYRDSKSGQSVPITQFRPEGA